MTTNTKLMNMVQQHIIKFSNEQGISLAAEFKSVDEFKRFVVSFSMHLLIEAGKTVQEAYDIVMGDGSYKQLSDDVWNLLEAQRAGV